MGDLITVLRDKDVDLKWLNKRVAAGLIIVYELDFEVPPKYGRFISPVGVYGRTKYSRAVYGDQATATRLAEILRIMGGGRRSLGDALTLDAAIRNGLLYVVTNNKNEFIRDGKRERLQALAEEVKIVTPEELDELIGFRPNA